MTMDPFVPERMRDARAHHDPDFAHLTYGDAQNPRGVSLRHIAPGDQLWFLARLWEHDGASFTGPSEFFFVGVFEVEANLAFERAVGPCPAALRRRLQTNAHWHRTRAGHPGSYRVIFGHPERSARFAHPVRVTPQIAGHLFGASYDARTDRYLDGASVVLNKNGKPRTWRHFCSITRTIQWYLDSAEERHVPHLEALRALAATAGLARAPGS
jgi:hypothetical protein